MQISVLLDRSRPDSLTTQMVDQIRDAIRCARIAPGSRLPSSRRLSEQLAISRNTVMRAYDLLLMEGIVESRPASGIYVAEQQPRPAATAAPASGRRRSDAAAADADAAAAARRASADSCQPQPVAVRLLSGTSERRSVSAQDLAPPVAGQPVPWRRRGSDAVWRAGGLPALRTAIANHLAAARGIMADPSRIVIVSGIQEGLTIAARLFLARGALSVVEDPCYLGAAKAFEAAGAEVVERRRRSGRIESGAAAAADGVAAVS